MLKIDNLKVEVDDKVIIDGLSLSLPRGEVHVIMGPNGVGKSTILRTIMGDPHYKVVRGKITYNNEDILKMTTSDRAKIGIFMLEQNPTEIPGVTNAEMLRAALGDRGIKESIFEFNKRLNKAIEDLGISSTYLHRNINEFMSGGEKKKNEMLQIEVLRPSLILLDEMDSGLDVDSLKTLSLGLERYKNETKASILIITHHTNILEYLHPDKVYILADGKISMEGDVTLAQSIEKSGFKGAFSVNGK
ncbi:MAG TPA: Fe-S cluster assembly ATPase SufC [Firmicutes bacterium]|nr:Fe-S cluster assembly ATPase SufC [Bacillota bacterium]